MMSTFDNGWENNFRSFEKIFAKNKFFAASPEEYLELLFACEAKINRSETVANLINNLYL